MKGGQVYASGASPRPAQSSRVEEEGKMVGPIVGCLLVCACLASNATRARARGSRGRQARPRLRRAAQHANHADQPGRRQTGPPRARASPRGSSGRSRSRRLGIRTVASRSAPSWTAAIGARRCSRSPTRYWGRCRRVPVASPSRRSSTSARSRVISTSRSVRARPRPCGQRRSPCAPHRAS
jgi:hypothetical protein